MNCGRVMNEAVLCPCCARQTHSGVRLPGGSKPAPLRHNRAAFSISTRSVFHPPTNSCLTPIPIPALVSFPPHQGGSSDQATKMSSLFIAALFGFGIKFFIVKRSHRVFCEFLSTSLMLQWVDFKSNGETSRALSSSLLVDEWMNE